MELSELDQLKQRLDDLRPLPPEAVRNLREALVLNWTYHSNAIEGNTLTLLETKVVLEGITVGGKLLREHFEAINHRDAIDYIEDVVHQREPLSEWQIRNLHRVVLKDIDTPNAGVYRKINVTIAGARHVPPDAPPGVFEALDAAHVDGNLAPFTALVTECMREAFAQYWFVLRVA